MIRGGIGLSTTAGLRGNPRAPACCGRAALLGARHTRAMFGGRMIRVVQIARETEDGVLDRRVALVDEPRLRLIDGSGTLYQLAGEAIESGRQLREVITAALSTESIGYDDVYAGRSEWRLLVPFDHPQCLVTG